VDAVVICAPSHLHAELATAALGAGKHVFIEKPIATNARDARCVIEAAERSGLATMVGFNRRFHLLFEQARKLIINGEIGRVHHVQSAFCEPMPAEELSVWRQRRDTGGGVLLDLASHHIDLVRWFLNDDVESVECSLSSQATEHDTASLSLSMVNGASVQSFFSYRAARVDSLELIGERGTLRVDRHQPRIFLRVARRFGYGTRRAFVMPDASRAKFRAQRIVRPSKDPSYERALGAFVDSIRGRPSRIASLDDGARALDVVLAAEESARSRSRIRLEE
jgi:predicted dehydrogenase